MASLLKWLFGLVIVLVLLVVAAAVILPMVVDPNDYKPQIVAAAKDKLGRDLAIEQDLNLTVFPWLGIETGGVRVGNAAGFTEQAFAEVDQLGLRVKLMPLLRQQVEVDTLVVKGLRLNLEKDASGRTNWDDLAGPEEAEPAQAEKSDQQTADAESGVALSIQGVQIEDARISWDDRQAGQRYVLDGVRVVTGALAPGATVPVEAGITFTSSKPAMTLKADLTTNVGSDADLAVFRVAGLVLSLDATGEGLPDGGARLTLKADAVADTNADTLAVERLDISGPAMAASGELTVSAMQTDPAAKGALRIAETNLKTLASMFASPIETVDPSALTRASGDVAFDYAGGVLKLEPITLRLDDSSLNGHLHLLDASGPVVRAKLELDQIDLDRYMPPAAATAEASTASAPQADKSAAPTAVREDPFAALRTLDFVGEFKIGNLKVNNLRMNNVTTKVVSRKGVVKVDPMSARLYEGGFEGSAVLDTRGKQPKLSANNHLSDIQIGPLLKDVAGDDRLVGRGELHADVSMVGFSEAEIRRSLNGTSRFAFRDGALKGVNIAQVIRGASGKLGLGGEQMDTGTPGQTDFTEISASLTMTDGVIRNQDLQAKSPLLRIAGEGQVDLPKDSIDYLITTELVKSLAGQGGKGRDELAGIEIPVRVSGPLGKPSYRPDLQAALSAKAKAELEEKKVELQQKAEEKVKEKLDGVFRGLFK